MSKPKISIVGAGISGLSLAYFLDKRGLQIEVFEENSRPGGMIRSQHHANLGLQEHAANAFINSELLDDICQELQLKPLSPLKTSKARFILWQNKMRRWPLGPLESLVFAFRLLKFLFNPTRAPQKGETVEDWTLRHFGSSVCKKLLAPALLGVYATAARNLSATLVLGRFFSIEALRALKNMRPPTTRKVKKTSTSFSLGLEELCQGLESYLTNKGVKFNYQSTVNEEQLRDLKKMGCVVLAGNLRQSAKLITGIVPNLAQQMKTLPMTKITTVTVFLKNYQALKKGFGVLMAEENQLKTRGVLMNNCIFENRNASSELWSETWILDGIMNEEEFLAIYEQERPLIFGDEQRPFSIKLKVWPEAFPVYGLKLENFLSEFNSLPKIDDNLYLTGNYLGRIGIAQIVEQNYAIAELMTNERSKVL